MIRYYARLNASRADKQLLNRPEVLKLSDFGAQLGFGLSVLEQRGLCQAEATGAPAPGTLPPLLTWPFLDFLEHLDLGQQSLVELGSGHSTIWFSQRFANVRSFETDPEWYRALAAKVEANVDLSLIAPAELERAQLEYRDEAWLLVDFAGKRTAFLNQFLAKRSRTNRPQAIVLDNSEWYRRGARLLAQQGYLEVPFYGFKSGQSWISCTSLFVDPARFAPRQKAHFYMPPFSREMDNSWDQL
ncbi:MAG: hypothetical protein WDO74_09380 [Pseudomonadota bacterium]